ncbi:adenylate cyclase [Streptococcus sp. UMB1385]|nr:adenylate cyclase [Streptococcus sp. UMB1385]
MREIEIEFKNLLTENQYDALYEKYDLSNSEEIINKNFYYDDTDESFKKIGAALRIRYTNKKTEITLKIKGDTQNVEINVPLDERYPKEPTVLPILPNEIISELERMNVKIKTPMLIQKIETLRHEVTLEEGLLVLDKTTFINDIVDYELEFETKDYESGLAAFEKLLEENNIDKSPAKPKIARAVEYSKR